MLLSHSAGFQNGTWPYGDGKPWEPFEPTTWEQLVAMMPYQEVAFKPGSKYSYSNPGFIYLGRIVEQLTGDPWEGYVQKNIFAPLGITRSYFGGTPYYLADHRSNNYYVTRDSSGRERVNANGRDFDPGITIPNGGWNAPLGDIARWVSFLTNAAHGDSATRRLFDTVLPHATLEEMWRPTHPISTNPAAPQSMGMSYFLLPRRFGGDTVTFVGHTGSQAGFRAYFYWNPHTGDAVIAAFNTSNSASGRESSAGFSALAETAIGMMGSWRAVP
jgi:CubicO group peptidase (beta-lactamase class C family)